MKKIRAKKIVNMGMALFIGALALISAKYWGAPEWAYKSIGLLATWQHLDFSNIMDRIDK